MRTELTERERWEIGAFCQAKIHTLRFGRFKETRENMEEEKFFSSLYDKMKIGKIDIGRLLKEEERNNSNVEGTGQKGK